MNDFSSFQNIPGLLGRLYTTETEFDRRERVPFPPINLVADGKALYIRALVPGVDFKRISLTFHESDLTLEGRSPLATGTYIRQERFSGAFRRVVKLPFAVRLDEVRAHLLHGVLEIVLPRADSALSPLSRAL